MPVITLIQRHIDRYAAGSRQQRVAIGRRTHHRFDADGGTTAGTIVDNYRLAPRLVKFLR
jgi:hypothetical protein